MRRSDEAVSPVVGTILLIVIAIALAATVLFLVNRIVDEQPEPAPLIGFDQDDSADQARVVTAEEGLQWDHLVMLGSCDPLLNGNPYPPAPGTLVAPGDVLTCASGETLLVASDGEHGGALLLDVRFQ